MGSRAPLRPAATSAALTGLAGLTLLASGCTSHPTIALPPALTSSHGQVQSAPAGSGRTGTAPAACSLLTAGDVLAVAGTVHGITITIDGHTHQNNSSQQISTCGFNQKGVYTSSGMTSTDSGDHWAQVTVLTDAPYDFSPAGYPAISGLGDGAYWDDGQQQAVIREGQDVLDVTDDVPANIDLHPDLEAACRQAAEALAARILSRWP
ncbi:MAG TPA: hypothetical protein VGS19_14150 [Streptosporangiaceae bacterium]|nr:hypothetical protein [Streptosporangiaceae bacterium]